MFNAISSFSEISLFLTEFFMSLIPSKRCHKVAKLTQILSTTDLNILCFLVLFFGPALKMSEKIRPQYPHSHLTFLTFFGKSRPPAHRYNFIPSSLSRITAKNWRVHFCSLPIALASKSALFSSSLSRIYCIKMPTTMLMVIFQFAISNAFG